MELTGSNELEIGSIYAWTSQTNDITHWAYEARMYNYEYPTEVRESDPNVHSVTVVDELAQRWLEWGYTSTYQNVSISLPNNISTYDTLKYSMNMHVKTEGIDMQNLTEVMEDVMSGIILLT